MPQKPPPYVDRSYTHLQLIAWEHFTDELTKPGDEPQVNPTRPNDDPNGLPIPIFSNKMPLDERIRLKRLYGIVELARQKLQNTDSSKTLKIFLAPEFTFRPWKDESAQAKNEGIGPDNTYTREAMTRIVSAMREMFSDEKYRDWLFVPGTILWSETVKTEVTTKTLGISSTQIVDDYVFFNTALMFKGGAMNAPFTCIHKHAASFGDKANVKKSADKNPLFKDLLGKKEDPRFSMVGHNVLDTDGIRFGLEVCLDHGAKILKNAVMRDHYFKEKGEGPYVDVHLLVACDKVVEPSNLAIAEDGYFMRVDGALGLAKMAKQRTPGYGMIPCKSSSIFRCVPLKEMPQEYAKDDPEIAKMVLEDIVPVYVSHIDENGQNMLEAAWVETPQGPLETWAPQGAQRLVAYKPQPYKPMVQQVQLP
jgi:hypothetical protein